MTGRLAAVVTMLLLGLARPAGYAQENPARLDSIIPLLDRAKKDTLQLTMLIWACESWTTSPHAEPYLRRLDTLSNELLEDPDPRTRARARHAHGAYHFFRGYHAKFERNIPLALASFHQAINDFEAGAHQHAIGQCLDALGLVYGLAGDLDRADQAFRDELRIARAIGHPSLRTQALVHLASIRASSGDASAAWSYLDSCGSGSAADSSMVLNERARIRTLQGRGTEAEALLRRSLAVAARSDNAWDSLPAITPLIRLLNASGRPAEGLRMALACARLGERIGDATAHCGCLNLAGDAHRASGDLANATQWYEHGLALAERIGNIGVARELGDEGSMLYATAALKEMYRSQGRIADALAMTDRWAALKDSVQSMNGREEVLRSHFAEEALRDSLAREAQQHARTLEEDRRRSSERLQRYAIIGLCIAAIATALAFRGRYRLLHRTNQAILRAQQEVVASEKQRENEQVRTRIARDIHDDIGSGLTKIAMLGSEAKRRVNDRSEELRSTLDRITAHSREVSAALSDIVRSVDPAHDTSQELVEHARAVAQRLLEDSGVPYDLRFHHHGPAHAVEPGTKHHIVMVMKEAINNALKHAGAQHITVELEAGSHRVRLVVADDGRGFDPQASARTGNGSRNMRARAEAIGATLSITTTPGNGCTVALEGPFL